MLGRGLVVCTAPTGRPQDTQYSVDGSGIAESNGWMPTQSHLNVVEVCGQLLYLVLAGSCPAAALSVILVSSVATFWKVRLCLMFWGTCACSRAGCRRAPGPLAAAAPAAARAVAVACSSARPWHAHPRLLSPPSADGLLHGHHRVGARPSQAYAIAHLRDGLGADLPRRPLQVQVGGQGGLRCSGVRACMGLGLP